jgi:adenylate cyclase
MKHTGDGAEVAFPSVAAAAAAAVRMQKGFARHSRDDPARGLRVRIGINVGEPLAEDGDLFGSAVNLAARVCDRAKGGEILVTDAARRLVDSPEIRFRARGRARLRGIRAPVELFQIVW